MRFHWSTGWLDDQSRVLQVGATTRPLTPKAFALFRYLLNASPRVVPKEELLDEVWPDTYVSEANLPVLVGEIRTAIGDSSREPTIIKTHFGVGYSVIDRVVTASGAPMAGPPGATPVLLIGGRRVVLGQGTHTLGRDEHCAIVIIDESVSRHHADVLVRGDEVEIVDRSKNGTFVDGVRIETRARLASGTTLRFGATTAQFRVERGDGSTRTLMT